MEEKIVLVRKRSRWERDFTHREAKSVSPQFSEIFESHQRQQEGFDRIKELAGIRFILRSELSFLESDGVELIVSFGGDNHFIYVSRYAGQIPLLGVNSDPISSTGALLYFTPKIFVENLSSLRDQGDSEHLLERLETEHWTKIEGELQYPNQSKSIQLGPCVSEISIKSRFHGYISNFQIRKNQEEWEEIKCSGLLLASGAGSTGWYRNCHFTGDDPSFPKDSNYFQAIARETNFQSRSEIRHLNPTVHFDERLDVVSQMDGEISIDANKEQTFSFPSGAHASFFLSKERLHVVRRFAKT